MDPLLDAFAELRAHAEVFDRYRVTYDGRSVKGVSLNDALDTAAKHDGRVDRAELWSLPGGFELLTPWQPINLPKESA